MRSRLDEVQQTIGTKVDVNDADLLAQYRTQRYQPFTVMENVTPDQVGKIQAAGLEARASGSRPRRFAIYPRGTELAHVLGYLSRDQQRNRGKYLSGDVIYDRYKGATGHRAGFQPGPDRQGRPLHDFDHAGRLRALRRVVDPRHLRRQRAPEHRLQNPGGGRAGDGEQPEKDEGRRS
jgi:hypothetical protein